MVSPDWTDVSWWLLVLDGAGILAIWEIGSILTHRWHTVSWLSWRYPVLRYLILLAAGLFAAWWIQHTSHPPSYLHVGAGASVGLWAILQWLERSEVARWWKLGPFRFTDQFIRTPFAWIRENGWRSLHVSYWRRP